MCVNHRRECIHWLLNLLALSSALPHWILSLSETAAFLWVFPILKTSLCIHSQSGCAPAQTIIEVSDLTKWGWGKEEPTKSSCDQEHIMRNQTFMCINYPSAMLIYHHTAEHSGFPWVVGLLSPPSIQWHSPSPACPFFNFCRKFQKVSFY